MSKVVTNFLYPQSTVRTFASAMGLTASPVGVKLLDISENQSRDLAKSFPALLLDGYGGVIIRATDGLLKDKNYDYFYPAALDAGMVVMVYAALYASRNGATQAEFLLNTVSKLYDEVDGNLVAWADGETKDGVSVAVHRTELLRWLAWASDTLPKVGAYGSLKTWSELYGNMVLPSQYYFWNAQWRSGTTYTVPTGVTREQTVIWQNGRWPFDSWIPQPDNLPRTEDVDCNVMPGKSMEYLREFTGQDGTEPPIPPTDHEHPEMQEQIDNLYSLVVKQGNEISALDTAFDNLTMTIINLPKNSLPTAKYIPTEHSSAYRVKSFNAAKNEVFDFYPTGSAEDVGKRIPIDVGDKIDVFIEPLYVGDSSFKALLIVDSAFLAKYKPMCPIYVNASKGSLQVP